LAFIQDFAVLIRKTLLYSRKNLIPFRDEVDFLKLYIKLENSRFETPFSLSIDLKDDEDYYNIHMPPLLLQPYVENAIKHGLFNKADHTKNSLIIKFRLEMDLLICTIQDNGVGRDIANEKKKKHHVSQGLQMMQERLDYLNVVYKEARFEHKFSDVRNEKGIIAGTQVIVKIPLYLKR
jgi:LytS/YehU family sensor histidine kinase